MFTLSSDGDYAKISNFIVTAPNTALDTRWFFDDNLVIEGPTASHVFDSSGWHTICMTSCSGLNEVQICSAVGVRSMMTNDIKMESATLQQGTISEPFQISLSSNCEPPFEVELEALKVCSTPYEKLPNTIWDKLIPSHAFYNDSDEVVKSINLTHDEVTFEDVVIGYVATGSFKFRDDIPSKQLELVVNYEPDCEVCKGDRPNDTIKIIQNEESEYGEPIEFPTEIFVDLEEDYISYLKRTVPYIFTDPFECITYSYSIVELSQFKVSQAATPRIVDFDEEPENILYIGSNGNDGYGQASNGYIDDLLKSGKNVSRSTINFMDDSSEFHSELLDVPLDYDTVIIHSIPENWKVLCEQNKDLWKDVRIIGVTVWETDALLDEWVEISNNFVDEIWLPTEWNKQVFQESGVITPIKIKPHKFVPMEQSKKEDIKLSGYRKKKDEFVFYTIGQWNTRKNIAGTIKAFCEAFTKKDNVSLIVKTYIEKQTKSDERQTKLLVTDIMNKYSNPPKITVINKLYSDTEIVDLHTVGDCFVSLCRSEGWGLGAFDAMNFGNEVIITGYGGQVSYLGEDHPYLIDYDLVTANVKPFYVPPQQWAEPKIEDAVGKMVDVFENKS